MKKKIFLKFSTLLLLTGTLFLSSCLKDSRFVDFSKVGTVVDFPLGGTLNFGSDAITESTDTVVRQFSINVASPNLPTSSTSITLSVNDPAVIAAYNASNTAVAFVAMPTSAFVFNTTTVTIPAGKNTAILSVTIYKNQLDPSKSYMLPIAIVSSPGATVSANLGTHYFHVIGNPFAGNYTWNFTRYNTSDGSGAVSSASFTGKTVTISPVTPTQFEVTSGYYLATEKYEVTFTQVDATHFSNFQITFNATDVANVFVANGISVTQQPVFAYGVTPAYDPNAIYSYTDALKLFTFQYVVYNGSASRFCIDNYVHQ